MDGWGKSPGGLLVPLPGPAVAPPLARPSGLILPGIPVTAGMLGLAQVPEHHTWLDDMVRVYLPAREYLGPFEAARGRVFDRDAWVRVLLTRFTAEEYLCQLAVLNRAAISDELTAPFEERFLGRIAPDAAEAVARAMSGGIDGFRRWFLARQLVLHAMRLVLVPPEEPGTAAGDPVLEGWLRGIDLETAAVLLVHLAGDALRHERQPGDARYGGVSESLAMEMNANSLFNDRDDDGGLLARYRLVWLDCGSRLRRYAPQLPPAGMLAEAAGVALDDMTALALVYWWCLQARGPGDPVPVNVTAVAPQMIIPPSAVEAFLRLFSCTTAVLAAELRQCPLPWQMRPFQARPLLRMGNGVVVLDERYLIERVTRGLYWLVHDYEKHAHGDRARGAWTQAWGEMVETRVEDQLRQMAPPLLAGKRAFFTEEDLQAAFPGSRNCDAGIDFGGDVVLAEVVSGTVKTQTRELADPVSFEEDAERIVLGKARQLYQAAANLLRSPQPAASPLASPPRRIFPVVVTSGQFPVNPLTIRYVNEQLAREGHLPDGTVQLLTVLDLEELEVCQSLARAGTTLPQLLDAWRSSPHRDTAFRNYLAYVIGGQHTGRPDDVQRALADTFSAVQQRLGVPGPWTPPPNPPEKT